MSLDLPRLLLLWLLKNQDLSFFTQKLVFQLIVLLKTSIKHRKNRDKLIYGIKKSPQNP
jgi:hypothetical protein